MLYNLCQTNRLSKRKVEHITRNIKKQERNTPPIMVVVKKYGNNSQTLHFFKIAHKKPRIPSPYEKLGRANLWDWFTPNGELKPNYIHATRFGTTIKPNKKNLQVLGEHPKL
jgi:hypothetical protein